MGENKIKYKVLRNDLTSPYQNFKFCHNCWYHEPEIGELGKNGCYVGLYATDVEGLLFRGVWRDDEAVYRCKVKGREAGEAPLKTCYEYLQVVERVSDEEVKQLARDVETKLGYRLSEALYPVDPRQVIRKRLVPTDAEIELLEQYIQVGESVRESVWESVGASVRSSAWDSVWSSAWDSVGSYVWTSVRESVWESVGESVGESVRSSVGSSGSSIGDSVGSYVGSLFPQIEKWRHVNREREVYPFQSGADLWRAGLVPSYDGKVWRLHAGQNMKVVFKND